MTMRSFVLILMVLFLVGAWWIDADPLRTMLAVPAFLLVAVMEEYDYRKKMADKKREGGG